MKTKVYDPYLQWKRMDNYLLAFLIENRDVDEQTKDKLKQFRVQYLTKVANIARDEASAFQRDISPWRSPNRGDYHRFYRENNSLLQAIATEISNRIGIDREKIILLSSQELMEEYIPYYSEFQGQKMLVVPNSSEKEKVLKVMIERGFTPALQEAAAMVACLDLDQPNTSFEFPEKENVSLHFHEFIMHPIFIAFKQFAKNSFSASIVVDLLEGFSTMDLDEGFQQKNLSALIQDSYGRVLHFLNQSMQFSVDLQKFENFMELVYEEMILWLMIIEPYSQGELERLIQKIIKSPAFFRTVQSGMAAFSEVIRILLNKESQVLYYDDCYFENIALIQGPNSKAVRFPNYEASLNEQLSGLGDKKIDLLFVDFHNYLLYRKFKSERHDIKEILLKVLPHASDSFCLIIDHTIGSLHSDEIDDLLQTFPRLNVVVLWSHQKFDMFGTDKFTAGSYCVYSQDMGLIERFKWIRGGEIDSVSRQGLTHFFALGSKKLEERRERIFWNARYVNERIDPKIDAVVIQCDPIHYSVDVQLECDLEEEIAILKKFEERGVPLMTRPSFGYNMTTASFVPKQMVRFSIGIEDQKFLDQFIEAFNAIFSIEPVASKRIRKSVDEYLNRA